MADYSQGIDAIARLVNMITPLQDISAAMSRLGQIETATEKALADKVKVMSDLEGANASLAVQEGKIDSVQSSLAQMLSDANKERLMVLSDSKDQAAKIIALAEGQASDLIAKANSSIDAQLLDAQSKFDQINSNIEKANIDFKSILATSDKAVADATAAQAKLDAIKEQVAKMIN